MSYVLTSMPEILLYRTYIAGPICIIPSERFNNAYSLERFYN